MLILITILFPKHFQIFNKFIQSIKIQLQFVTPNQGQIPREIKHLNEIGFFKYIMSAAIMEELMD